MSAEAYKAFGKKLSEDESLRKKFKQVGAENVDGIIALAKENGFDITKEDFVAAAKEFVASNELSDDDLQNVAGGNAVALVATGAAVAAVASRWF